MQIDEGCHMSHTVLCLAVNVLVVIDVDMSNVEHLRCFVQRFGHFVLIDYRVLMDAF